MRAQTGPTLEPLGYASTFRRACVCMRLCVHLCVRLRVHACVCERARVHVCMCLCVGVFVCPFVCEQEDA